MRRPVVAIRTPIVEASRAPDIAATPRKRKRFGDNTGISSGFLQGALSNIIKEKHVFLKKVLATSLMFSRLFS